MYCRNTLVVEGHQKDIDEFINKSKDENGEFSFNNFIPITNIKLNLDESYSYIDYFKDEVVRNNCYDKWGTRWDAFNTKYTNRYIYFETFLTPATEFVESVAQMYSNIKFTFSFHDPMMDYCGHIVYKNGICIIYKVYTIEIFICQDLIDKDYIQVLLDEIDIDYLLGKNYMNILMNQDCN